MNYKRKKTRNKIKAFPKNGSWSRMVHKWWIRFWSQKDFPRDKVRVRKWHD